MPALKKFCIDNYFHILIDKEGSEKTRVLEVEVNAIIKTASDFGEMNSIPKAVMGDFICALKNAATSGKFEYPNNTIIVDRQAYSAFEPVYKDAMNKMVWLQMVAE